MYLPPANFQQFTINDYDSVTVLVMTFFTVGFQPEGPLKEREDYKLFTDELHFVESWHYGRKGKLYFPVNTYLIST